MRRRILTTAFGNTFIRTLGRLTPALALLAGCAAITRAPTTVVNLQRDAISIDAQHRALRDTVIERLVRRVAKRGDRTVDVLMLSGGGQNGAFGVGFLRGWQQRAADSMPQFDLVTGISTGALQAPYALIGTRSAIDTITALYARAAQSFAPSLDWWFLIRPTGGLVNTKRFDQTIAQTLNGPLRDELQAAFANDQQLVFGTTDFDLGIGRMWSLGDEMGSARSGATDQRTRQLLKGATAIPGIFPPVMIDGHLQSDGGVIENILPLLTFEDYTRLGQRLQARGLTDVTVRVWVIMNLWTHGEPKVMKPSARRAISSRSTSLLFYAHQPATLAALENLSRAVSDRVPGVRMHVRVAAIPSAESLFPGANALFERRFMLRLDSLGFSKAQSATPWDAVTPSAFTRPEVPPRSR
ncbi:patatin-like phospholipase family protein [Gemmatimonas sp.]|uniref:patatin-like phospholipase family protein n=1 Tax=Gemmatimonas sp. TaxID=1962908 RepID=UPI003563118E